MGKRKCEPSRRVRVTANIDQENLVCRVPVLVALRYVVFQSWLLYIVRTVFMSCRLLPTTNALLLLVRRLATKHRLTAHTCQYVRREA